MKINVFGVCAHFLVGADEVLGWMVRGLRGFKAVMTSSKGENETCCLLESQH